MKVCKSFCLGVFTLFPLVSTSLANPACDPPPSGLVSWWKGEGNTLDSAGTNNGFMLGYNESQTTFGPAEVGEGFLSAGPKPGVSNEGGVSVGSNTNMALQNLTIEAWIQLSGSEVSDGTGGSGQIFGWGPGGYAFYMNSSGTLCLGTPLLNSGYGSSVSGPSVTDTLFHHVAVTKTGSTVVFYLDGVAYPAPAYNVTFTFTTAYAAIGVRPDAIVEIPYYGPVEATDNLFWGTIDELSLYNRALSGAEIQSIFNAGASGKCPVPPTLISQPANQTVVLGTNVSFSAVVMGTAPFSYQWSFDGTNLAGATDSELNLTNVQASNTGTYALTVANPSGLVTSSNAFLTVLHNLPNIQSQPADQSAYVGTSVNFSVTATGSLPLAYQWQFEGTNLDGATNSVLTLTNLTPEQAGEYDVIVSNPVGITASSNALLTVVPPQSCVLPPTGLVSWWRAEGNALDTAGGNNGTLTAGVSYGPGMVGQAFVFSASGAAVELGNPPSLDLEDLTIEGWIKRSSSSLVSLDGSGSDGYLICGNDGDFGVGLHSTGTLFLTAVGGPSVEASTAITDTNWHHVAVSRSSSDSVVFYVDGVASSPQVLDFFWGSPFGMVLGANGGANSFYGSIDELSVYNRPLSASEIQAIFSAGSEGKCTPLPVITAQPASESVFPGCAATFGVTASSALPLAYQWMKDGSALNGQTNSILSLSNVQSNDYGNYSVMVSNVGGDSVPSLTVSLAPGVAPVAGPCVLQRFASGGVKVRTSDLLANDNDMNTGASPLSVIAVSPTSASNGTVSLSSNWVYYTPPVGFTNTDTFTYTVSGGPCGGTNTGLVTVEVKPDSTPTGTFVLQSASRGSNVLTFDGFPNRSYRVQYTGNLAAPNWKDLSTNVTDNFGSFDIVDSTASNAPARFYRAVSP